MPDEVRDILREWCQNVQGGFFPEIPVAPGQVKIISDWLDAQPEAPEPTERWEPVEDMRWLGGLHSFNDIRVIDGMILGVWLSAPGVPPVTANIELPDNVRLCRRVEVTP